MGVKVIDFHAEWCGPCDQQEPILDEVKDNWEENDNVGFDMVDIDENEDIAQEHQVRSIPTIILLSVDNAGVDLDDMEDYEEYERFIGVTGEDRINDGIESGLED